MKKGSTILLIDDENSYRLVLKNVLEENGYIVQEASNGAIGLEILRTSKVDLAIVDLEMPVMDGIEFTRWVKELDPKFPIVIITAHERNFSPTEIISTDVEAFLHKPFELEELLKTVEAIV
jgi:CheY-like chemotaxis protein